MASKKVAPLDRVERNGVKATVTHFHEGPKGANNPSVSVLLDDVNRADVKCSQHWSLSECKMLPPSTRCPRCREAHKIFYCPLNAPPARGPANPPRTQDVQDSAPEHPGLDAIEVDF